MSDTPCSTPFPIGERHGVDLGDIVSEGIDIAPPLVLSDKNRATLYEALRVATETYARYAREARDNNDMAIAEQFIKKVGEVKALALIVNAST